MEKATSGLGTGVASSLRFRQVVLPDPPVVISRTYRMPLPTYPGRNANGTAREGPMASAIFWGAVGAWVILVGVELVGLVQIWRGRGGD